ncbi:histidine phosphatase family protein [Mycolicibacterium celeriflavum]|uniref:Phosphoglycerate mutase n=1 Tax=Mycolicibacterium celeriflavum TaxID=1249101 RepID=A0A1X0BYA9_MYCCF|nr:histidine phosphatase family protein [Mycolicibacterium celeriflavum]MCV7236872.1 histidine phosphatase family protein [Mycolicibacterium celeriflavum]ORA49489.1 histidine phosphatase family protein [Mycolicibacterium celeriflavum]BBY43881.1 phosphoglycerate mutase [Mycolicibacterium celeriflavum]
MTILRRALTALAAALMLGASLPAAPASASPVITITFVRHAESVGNASGIIDTTVPGPSLTPTGQQQAKEVAARLCQTPHDGVYASTMVRTQQTAQPFADELGEQIVVLPGLREVEAGDLEGRPEAEATHGYLQPLQQWLTGDRSARIPGSIDGNEFDARFDEAVDTIYRSGHQRPVAYSHGAAIAMWTMMNVRNPPLELAATQPLPNTGLVVVQGNPQGGWTLLDWNGTKFD